MTIEDKLKNYILTRYSSVREFTIDAGMSYSTVATIFKRGINGASVGSVIKICDTLGISVDALAKGEIEPKGYSKPRQIMIEIKEIIDDLEDQLEHSPGLTIDGRPATKEEIKSIIQGAKIGAELAKSSKNLNKNLNKNHNKN